MDKISKRRRRIETVHKSERREKAAEFERSVVISGGTDHKIGHPGAANLLITVFQCFKHGQILLKNAILR